MADSGDRQPTLLETLTKVGSKRTRRAAQFSEIMRANTTLVDSLIEVAEKLSEAGADQEAEAAIGVIREVLNNNQKLQQVVSEALSDIGD